MENKTKIKHESIITDVKESLWSFLGSDKVTSKEAIYLRDTLSVDITKSWRTIRSENVVPKWVKRSQDLNKLLSDIEKKSQKRVAAKLALQAINMGFTSVKDIPKDWIYPVIFWLSEYNEMYVQLSELKKRSTIDLHLKRNSNRTEAIKSSIISKKSYEIARRINSLTAFLIEFNENAVLSLLE